MAGMAQREILIGSVSSRSRAGLTSYSTARSRHAPGTPRSSWLPRSRKEIPDPVTRSLTVDETNTVPGDALAATRAAMCTAKSCVSRRGSPPASGDLG
jgi:hypothetical protein